MQTISRVKGFDVARLGVIMSVESGEPHEAWGILNPGGARSLDGAFHLFPRLIAEGNYSRIAHATVRYARDRPVGADRLGLALAPREPYEVSAGGGGVEDARVVYVPKLARYVMTYTAFIPYEPRIAVAVSEDLLSWRRLGLVRYEAEPHVPDLNLSGNKDATLFPDVVSDPEGVPSFALLHRPTTRVVHVRDGGTDTRTPPSGDEPQEHIWISYVAIDSVLGNIAALSAVRRHERVMAPEKPWEINKVGAGAPPVRLPYGWALPYHAVSAPHGRTRYCMGVAILDLERPSSVLYRTPEPVLEPEAAYERNGPVSDVVFPTASDLRADGSLDIYYGAADRCIAAARVKLPARLPAS